MSTTNDPYAATSQEMSDWASATRSDWTAGSVGDPFVPPSTDGPRGGGRRRGLRLGVIAAGAALAVGSVSVGAYAAYEKFIGGGGAQPESALPSTAVAFAKVDLDPSGPQKVDAIRFARKFPKAPKEATKDDADLREVMFDQIQKSGGLSGLNYATDVRPWLGNRFGVALLPGSGDAPSVVVALAVTDQTKAKAGLAKAGDDAHCSVGKDFALCSDSQAVVDDAVKAAAKATLAEAPTFSADMKSLGEDGIATVWSDLSAADKLSGGLGFGSLGVRAPGSTLKAKSGRLVGALRFDGANLDLVGRVNALTDPPKVATGTGIDRLPEGTLVGVGLAGGDDVAKQLLDGLTAADSPLSSDLSDFTDSTGISLPGDLVTLLGSQTSIAFGGLDDSGNPKLALLTNSKKSDVQGVVDKLNDAGASPAGEPLTATESNGRTVVALSSSYADSVAKGSGLGGDAAFKAAVPDADKAQFAAYVDVTGLVSAFGDDLSTEDKADFSAFRAVGLSIGRDDNDATFRLRLTTK